ncbi:MAG: ABC transporter permease [Candidatus Dormibacteria bacterium]
MPIPAFLGHAARRSWVVVLLLGLWLAVGGGAGTSSPGAVANALARGVTSGSLTSALGLSLLRLAAALLPAVAVGVAAGAALCTSRILDDGIAPVLLAVQSIPSIAWLPVATAWLGPGTSAVIAVVFIGAFLPMVQATRSGVRGVDPVLARAGRVLGARGVFFYSNVLLPAALPAAVAGLRQAWAFAWRSLLAAELIYGEPSIGRLLNISQKHGDMATVFAVLVVIATVGLVVEIAFFGRLGYAVERNRGLGSAR